MAVIFTLLYISWDKNRVIIDVYRQIFKSWLLTQYIKTSEGLRSISFQPYIKWTELKAVIA
jgi:hypothetical protein